MKTLKFLSISLIVCMAVSALVSCDFQEIDFSKIIKENEKIENSESSITHNNISKFDENKTNDDEETSSEDNSSENINTSPSKGLEFTSLGNGTCYVSGIGTCTDIDVIVPSVSPDGDTVVTIYCGNIDDFSTIQSITIGKGVNISELYSSSLQNIYVDEENEYFKSINGVLYSKDGKELKMYPAGKKETSFSIPESVTTIGEFAFSGCSSLNEIIIPDSVTSIAKHSFSGCNGLENIVFGNGVTADIVFGFIHSSNVGDATSISLSGCSNLKNITIGSGITSVSISALQQFSIVNIIVDENNENLKSIDGNLYSKDGKTLVFYATGKTNTTFAIPDGVTSIGSGAFAHCTSLESMVIPKSVTSVGYMAFNGCTNLDTIYYTGSEEDFELIEGVYTSATEFPLNGGLLVRDETIIYDYIPE